MFKKTFAKLCTMFVVAVLAVCAFSMSAFADNYIYTVNADGVGLKSARDMSASFNIVVGNGTQVDMVSGPVDGWYQVGYQGNNGWIRADYLTCTNADATGTTASWPRDGYNTTTTADLRLRANPNTSSAVYCTIPRGQTVYVHSHGNGWAYVYWGSQYTGYVSTSYLSCFNGGGNNPAPAPAPSSGYAVTTAAVNLRSVPTAVDNTPIAVIPGGTTVQVVGASNGWSNVYYNGIRGWVSASYLTGSSQPSQPQQQGIDGGCKDPSAESGWMTVNQNRVTTANVNLRSGAGTQYTKVATIPSGQQVHIVCTNGSWYYVYWGSQYTGFVSCDYVS